MYAQRVTVPSKPKHHEFLWTVCRAGGKCPGTHPRRFWPNDVAMCGSSVLVPVFEPLGNEYWRQVSSKCLLARKVLTITD